MTTSSETELRELKTLINNRFDQLNSRFDQIEQKVNDLTKDVNALREDFNSLKMDVGKIEARLDEWKPSIHKISDLAEKVGELKNWRQIALMIISATFAATMGWFLRGGKL